MPEIENVPAIERGADEKTSSEQEKQKKEKALQEHRDIFREFMKLEYPEGK